VSGLIRGWARDAPVGDPVLGVDHPGQLLETLEDGVQDVGRGRVVGVDVVVDPAGVPATAYRAAVIRSTVSAVSISSAGSSGRLVVPATVCTAPSAWSVLVMSLPS
jgi:hypothetical protein